MLSGISDLNISGAITAGYETDPEFAKLVGTLDETSELSDRVGVVTVRDGQIKGYYQNGLGLTNAITEKYELEGKVITLVGCGSVARGLIDTLNKRFGEKVTINLYNRSKDKALKLKKIFANVNDVGGLQDLQDAKGDILVNATRIGSSKAPDDGKILTGQVISSHLAIVDVSFLPFETEFIKRARNQNKLIIHGGDMFAHQGAVCLETILDIEVDMSILKPIVIEYLKSRLKY